MRTIGDLVFDGAWTKKLETKYHWELYWHQVKLIEDEVFVEESRTVLEVGVGSGFIRNYLRSRGHDVYSIDADPHKAADECADIRTVELKQVYDLGLAYEVFEHFPFADLPAVARKLRNSCRKGLAVSLPNHKIDLLSVSLKAWRLGAMEKHVRLPRFRRTALMSPAHHWEVNDKDVKEKAVLELFERAGFQLKTRTEFGKHLYFRFA